jgi:hypothetical protein
MTRRAMVEVLEPATTRDYYSLRVGVRMRVILRLAVYRQSVHFRENPLDTHDQNFYFPNEHLRL